MLGRIQRRILNSYGHDYILPIHFAIKLVSPDFVTVLLELGGTYTSNSMEHALRIKDPPAAALMVRRFLKEDPTISQLDVLVALHRLSGSGTKGSVNAVLLIGFGMMISMSDVQYPSETLIIFIRFGFDDLLGYLLPKGLEPPDSSFHVLTS